MKKFYKSLVSNEIVSEKEYLEIIDNEAIDLYDEDNDITFEAFKNSLIEQESDFVLCDGAGNELREW